MRLDLVPPRVEKAKKPIKVKPSCGTRQEMDAHVRSHVYIVRVCVQQRCVCKHGRETREADDPVFSADTKRGVPQCGSIAQSVG